MKPDVRMVVVGLAIMIASSIYACCTIDPKGPCAGAPLCVAVDGGSP